MEDHLGDALLLASVLPSVDTLSLLNINGVKLTPGGVAAIAHTLPLFKHLHTLSFSFEDFGLVGARALAIVMPKLSSNLTSLSLGYNWMESDGVLAIFHALYAMRELKELNLAAILQESDDLTQAVTLLASQLPVLRHLVFLDLCSNDLDEDAMRILAPALFTNNLQTLEIYWNQLGVGGIAVLASSLSHAHSLTSLEISNNQIDEAAARELAAGLIHAPGFKVTLH